MNKDVLTATGDSFQQAMAKDQIAFLINTNSVVAPILQLNPNAKIGFMPLPAYHPDYKRQLVGGEQDAVGICKDTKYKAEAQTGFICQAACGASCSRWEPLSYRVKRPPRMPRK